MHLSRNLLSVASTSLLSAANHVRTEKKLALWCQVHISSLHSKILVIYTNRAEMSKALSSVLYCKSYCGFLCANEYFANGFNSEEPNNDSVLSYINSSCIQINKSCLDARYLARFCQKIDLFSDFSIETLEPWPSNASHERD